MVAGSGWSLLPQVQETLAELAAVEGMHGSQDLFRARVSPLLEWLAASHRDWTGHSVELLQLDVVLTHSGEPWTGAPSWVQSIAAVAALAAPAQTGGAALTTQPATHRGPWVCCPGPGVERQRGQRPQRSWRAPLPSAVSGPVTSSKFFNLSVCPHFLIYKIEVIIAGPSL